MTIDLTFEGLNLAAAGTTTVLRIMLEDEIIQVKITKNCLCIFIWILWRDKSMLLFVLPHNTYSDHCGIAFLTSSNTCPILFTIKIAYQPMSYRYVPRIESSDNKARSLLCTTKKYNLKSLREREPPWLNIPSEIFIVIRSLNFLRSLKCLLRQKC